MHDETIGNDQAPILSRDDYSHERSHRCPRGQGAMIGLDTNVLVRYVVQDDPQQSPKATRLIESLTADVPGYVTVVSLVELVWVLTSCYDSTKQEICAVLETLLRAEELVVAEADTVWKALRVYRDGKTDFADSLIECSANAAGCTHTATFDSNAVKGSGMSLIE
jgi:predicted nucleic-acid-binding protein